MIQNPALLFLILLSLVLLVLELDKRKVFLKLFHFLPPPFWCYFLPMVLATLGVLPEKSNVYTFLTTYLLSGCLILLLLSVSLPNILRLGPTALGALAAGSVGIGLGAVGSYAIFSKWLPEETWKGIGALSASWTGGSANMLAVKESMQTPESVFAPMVIVDTVITYLWMGIMIALAGFQDRWDLWVKADRSRLDDAAQRLGSDTNTDPKALDLSASWRAIHAFLLIGGSMLIGAGCLWVGRRLPSFGGTLNYAGWAFLMVTLIGILLSLSPASKLERYGASRYGYFCLYLLLAAIGAKARLQSILQAPILLVMAMVWVSIHVAILALYGYVKRVPMFFLAAASQANIGGTASAPIVAGIYQSKLAAVGLLLAIAANVYGTYFGILIAHACHWTQ